MKFRNLCVQIFLNRIGESLFTMFVSISTLLSDRATKLLILNIESTWYD